jgi:hypothetical protein
MIQEVKECKYTKEQPRGRALLFQFPHSRHDRFLKQWLVIYSDDTETYAMCWRGSDAIDKIRHDTVISFIFIHFASDCELMTQGARVPYSGLN